MSLDSTDDSSWCTMSTNSENGETDETGDSGEMRKIEDEKYEIENRFDNCGHYISGCKIVAKCCDKEFGCRMCHDSEISDHQINRYDIMEIVCNACNTRQPVSNLCANTECTNNTNNAEFAKYYCGICHLYSNEPKSEIYHCDKCNICRMCGVGYTRDDYCHCDKCGGCINKSIKDTHKCISEAFNNDCCICLESVFLSRDSTIILPCGHIIHSDCYISSLRQNRYTCPLCRKTMITGYTLQNMIEEYDRIISTLEYTQNVKVQIICNDCGVKGEVRFHPMGLKCGGCGGYNTSTTGAGAGAGNAEQ
jgi:RING finger/CHY zinc finger protein 1